MSALTYCLYRQAEQLSRSLPRSRALRLAERISDLQWLWSAQDRRAVAENLGRIVGHPVRPYAAEVREVFRNFGRYLTEFFNSHRAWETVAVEGRQHLIQASAQGRGVILLSAHLGNWELGAVVIRRLGMSVTGLALPHTDPRVNRLFNAQRERCGVQVIPWGPEAITGCLNVLRRGGCLGLIGDRDFGTTAVRVPFLNGSVMLPRGPSVLSQRSGAPVLPVFFLREGDWAFRLCIEPPLPATGRGCPERLLQAYAQTLGRHVQNAPSQWLIFRPLWEASSVPMNPVRPIEMMQRS